VGWGLLLKMIFVNMMEKIDSTSDKVFWININKNPFQSNKCLILGIVYIPPESSRFFNQDELLIFENEVVDMCNLYENVMLTEDAYVHIGLLQDFS
jgi:hypothetical protein